MPLLCYDGLTTMLKAITLKLFGLVLKERKEELVGGVDLVDTSMALLNSTAN